MTNTELYINGVLVDTGGDLNVRLNRQLLNPGELNTKDAQYSFSISLPPTQTNHQAFNYAHVEETKNKFNREYRAALIINSVRVFVGNFRLSDINREGYKGNLYIPALKSIKDIFGELKLNQNPEYRISFTDFVPSINAYNLSAANGPQMAIFPYTLYGVLPKVPLNKNANTYSVRTLWDATVRMGMQDLAPSINPLLMLRHIFQAQGYSLQGDAFDDQKLSNLYLSYKNQDSYVQPWNYGQQAKIKLSGEWSSRYNKRADPDAEQLERGVNQGSDPTGQVYSCDFLDATNTKLTIVEDTGGNVIYKEVNDNEGVTWVSGQIRIPTSGFYKVELDASIHVFDWENWRATDPATGVQHMGGRTTHADNHFLANMYEIRLCRDRKSAEFGLSSPKLNGQFYYNNQPQNETFDAENIPKFFPQVDADGQINFIDLAHDKFHVLGFNFGNNTDYASPESPQYKNPRDSGVLTQIQAAKPSVSWLASENTEKPTRLAIDAPGYWKYGRIGDYDNEGDNPDMEIDYSAGPFATGQMLNGQGNPFTPDTGDIAGALYYEYYLSRYTGFLTYDTLFATTEYIDLRVYDSLTFSTEVPGKDDGAVVAFYDENFQFIGVGLETPAEGFSTIYTDEPITPPPLATFVRVTGGSLGGIIVNGSSTAAGNKILNRLPIQRWFSYLIETDPLDNYVGFAYVHNGVSTTPLLVAPFVNGSVEINTSFSTIADPLDDLKLTLYLTTPSFDVDGTLTIERKIIVDSEDVIAWEVTEKYKIELNNAPANYARRGTYQGATGFNNVWYAQGHAAAVVWFDAGELVTLASVSAEGRFRRNGMHSTHGWVAHEIYFDLSIQPFRVDPEWLKVSLSGNGTAPMDWDDPVNFDTDSINLVGFLSADIKTDDFIENFCKAFNLRLSQLSATAFTLDVKQSKTAVSTLYIDLDGVASVSGRANKPLGLPSLYKLGFTVDVDEIGYRDSQDDGGGSFETGVTEENVVEQKSFFSYNWYKDIIKVEAGGNVNIPIAVISKFDVWEPSLSYPEAMRKKYTDQAYRFWYYDGLLNDLGATFDFNGQALQIAKVSNEIAGLSILNYKNLQFTILDNFFTLLINGASHYTELEGYLTAIQYQALNGAVMAMFNGDLYYIAELTGYDPTARNKTKIKLIRKI